ncbi:putative neural-cadherin 2 isoform X3 [Cherax quadricarinatus]|uniref:putative neural-cadherin 2 isoform X3 n=1 Tax=Cherax quadricarinatus TaxID=27406 RepID=UPI002379645D|nr:putative neural-cadherin 2 isoform X2 [Cherax quadricarinatus]
MWKVTVLVRDGQASSLSGEKSQRLFPFTSRKAIEAKSKIDRQTQTPYFASSLSREHPKTKKRSRAEREVYPPFSRNSRETLRENQIEKLVRQSNTVTSLPRKLKRKMKDEESGEENQPVTFLPGHLHTLQKRRKRKESESERGDTLMGLSKKHRGATVNYGSEKEHPQLYTHIRLPRPFRREMEHQNESLVGSYLHHHSTFVLQQPLYTNNGNNMKFINKRFPSSSGTFTHMKYISKLSKTSSIVKDFKVVNKSIEVLMHNSFSHVISFTSAQKYGDSTSLKQSPISDTPDKQNSLIQTDRESLSLSFPIFLRTGRKKKSRFATEPRSNISSLKSTNSSTHIMNLNERSIENDSKITNSSTSFDPTKNADVDKKLIPNSNYNSKSLLPKSSDVSLNSTDIMHTSIKAARNTRSINYLMNNHSNNGALISDRGGCEDVDTFIWRPEYGSRDETVYPGSVDDGGDGEGLVHIVETVVTVMVKDINDNPPVFPNTTMFGDVQENGPIDLSVAVIAAWDADDASEGTNAKLTYAIEKNVIDELSGEAIFSVHPETGLVRTALCCLDRETTPEYYIQVVAADGGGLKGTGTVVVRLTDVNDNSPRLARREWELEVDETWGDGPPGNDTILEISATDRDTTNYFFYRVVEASGWGWEHFGLRAAGSTGQLYATKTLDYEDETHRRGFRFLVQVTDMGRGGWHDPRHLDAAWVTVHLRDVNDNPPVFHRPHAHITVREDTAPGTLLAALRAHDPDMTGHQEVEYRLTGGWDSLTVDASGDVTLVKSLDREAPGGALGEAIIVAVDGGTPPLSSTATLTITVTDVNDCPPRLIPPTVFHVVEGAPDKLLGVLKATDDDVWALGHGPPFNLTLASSNPPHVFTYIDLRFNRLLDSGRGGAEIWAVGGVDREEHRVLRAEVRVVDAGGLVTHESITVVVDDLNDNPMKPAAKTVYLWKSQVGGSEAPLGRVYVDDADDWDLGDKSFQWAGPPHPLFFLNTSDGAVFASSLITEGRYELRFHVSDRVWEQRGVESNMTVLVRLLTHDALSHAIPITLTPTTPTQLTRGWTPANGGGGLGRLMAGVLSVIGEKENLVEVMSVYNHQQDHYQPYHSSRTQLLPSDKPIISTFSTSTATASSVQVDQEAISREAPASCVWLSVRNIREGGTGGVYMNPVKLLGLLDLHSLQLQKATNLTVLVGAAELNSNWIEDEEQHIGPTPPPKDDNNAPDPSSAASRASTTLPLQVVDTNSTSLVTPRLTQSPVCHTHEPETCTPTSCLNGGRCVAYPSGSRCVCPGASWGSRCKVLARTFSGSGWVWVDPLPLCLPTTLSIRLLTQRPNALILYSGPLAPASQRQHATPTPMIALQIVNGLPQLLVEGRGGSLRLRINTTLHDGDWHSIHLYFTSQGVAMMTDLCGRGWGHPRAHDDSHCIVQEAWSSQVGPGTWAATGPMQVGGLAHAPPRPHTHGWREAPEAYPLHGCVSHLTVNAQLVDLGEPAFSQGSMGGCSLQDAACEGGVGGCGVRGRCVGGIKHPECECEAGWAGSGCSTPTVPSFLGWASYMKAALSFLPPPRAVSAQVRVRTRGVAQGLLLRLSAHHGAAAFTIHLRSGVACASVTGTGWTEQTVCVEGRPLADGNWHTIIAERYGYNLVISVDDGDGWSRRNESLPQLTLLTLGHKEGDGQETWPGTLQIDKHDAVTVGGVPEFVGVRLIAVHHDLNQTCVDDVRVCGRALPLTPAVNGTSWGQVTTSEGLMSGCPAPDACANITCPTPLSCHPTWDKPSCSCGPGRQQGSRECQDLDECLWKPCLHGGTCFNKEAGFLCLCSPAYTGEFCQWRTVAGSTHPLAVTTAIVGLSLSLLILVIFGVVYCVHLRRRWNNRAREERVDTEGGTILEVKYSDYEDTNFRGLKPDETQETLVECLKLRVSCGEHNITAGERPGETMSFTDVATPCTEGSGGHQPEVLLPKDDLRAYAYEGDGSSAGSFTSTVSGLRMELEEEEDIKPLVPEFLQVIDLLNNLPEGSRPYAAPPEEKEIRVIGCRKSSTKNERSTKLLCFIKRRYLPSTDDHTCHDLPRCVGNTSSRGGENSGGEVSTIC